MCMVDDWQFMHYSQLVCKQPGKNATISDLMRETYSTPFRDQINIDQDLLLKDELNKQLLGAKLISLETARDEYLGWENASREDIAVHLTKPNKDDIFHVKTTPCVNCGGPGHPKFRCEYCGT